MLWEKNKNVFILNSLVHSLAPTKLLSIVGTTESEKLLHTQLAAAVSWDGSCYWLQNVGVNILKIITAAYSSVYYVNEDDLGNCFSFAAYRNLLVYSSFILFPFTVCQIKHRRNLLEEWHKNCLPGQNTASIIFCCL